MDFQSFVHNWSNRVLLPVDELKRENADAGDISFKAPREEQTAVCPCSYERPAAPATRDRRVPVGSGQPPLLMYRGEMRRGHRRSTMRVMSEEAGTAMSFPGKFSPVGTSVVGEGQRGASAP